MTRRIITECPACTTRFQVTTGQLKIANGKVRCGACLEVFNAELYSASPTETDSDTGPTTDSATQSPTHPPTNILGSHSAKNQPDKDPIFAHVEVPEFIAPQTRQTAHVESREQTCLEKDKALDEKPNQTTNSAPVETDAVQEFDLDKPIQEYITQAAPTPPDEIADTDKSNKTSSNHLADGINLEQIINEPVEFTQRPEITTETPEKASTAEQPTYAAANTAPEIKKAPPFTAIRAEPVMIRATQPPSGLSGWWTFSCLIAALLLAGQYLWFNRATLATQPKFTNLYAIVCQKIECNLPVMQDISRINTARLVVQEHQQYQGALSVNLLLENQATYRQPYPAILLSFSDRKGVPISQRMFQPREYLHESIVDLTGMPVNQTLQISLDILDPGRRAVSYQAELRPASW